jgi:phosphatidate cytidylyltransferase
VPAVTPPEKRSNLGPRVLTAAGIAVVLLGSLFLAPKIAFAGVIAAICAVATGEFYGLTRHDHRKPNEVFGVIAAAAMPLAVLLLPDRGLMIVVSALVVAALLWHLWFSQITTSDTAMTVFGAVYVGLSLSHLVLMRSLEHGTVLVAVTMASVWADDVFAYFVGMAAGRHKLAPRISPNKSWEGFFAGAVCSVLVWVASYSLSATKLGDTGLKLPWLIGLGVAVPVAGLIGDLVESRFKREAGAKDSSGMLPGHGGFLDRFDSLILVSVVVYYIVVYARPL